SEATGRGGVQIQRVGAGVWGGVAGAGEDLGAGWVKTRAPATIQAATLPLPLSLGGTTVRVTDSQGTQRDAPLLFVSQLQTNFQIPAGTANGTASVSLITGNVVRSGSINIASGDPGLFTANPTGTGVASAGA